MSERIEKAAADGQALFGVEAPKGQTWIELAQEEARAFGVYLPDDIADFILWEKTAFPACDEAMIRQQVREHVRGNLYNMKVAFPPPPATGPTRFEKVDNDDGDGP